MNDLTERLEATLRHHAERVDAVADAQFVARLERARFAPQARKPTRTMHIALLTMCLALVAAAVVAVRTRPPAEENQSAASDTTASGTATATAMPSVDQEELPLLPVVGEVPREGDWGAFSHFAAMSADAVRLVRPGVDGTLETALIAATRFPQAGESSVWGDLRIDGRAAQRSFLDVGLSRVSLAGEPTITITGRDDLTLAESWSQFGGATVQPGGQPRIQLNHVPDDWRIIARGQVLSGVVAQFSVAGGVDVGQAQGATINSMTFNPLLTDSSVSLTEVSVRGTTAWQRSEPDLGVQLTWEEQPGRFVQVWAKTPESAIAAAQSLTFVDLDTWLRRTGSEPPQFPGHGSPQPQINRETLEASGPKIALNQPTIDGTDGRTYGAPGADMVGVLFDHWPGSDLIAGYVEPDALNEIDRTQWPIYDTSGTHIGTWHVCVGALMMGVERDAFPTCDELRARFGDTNPTAVTDAP